VEGAIELETAAGELEIRARTSYGDITIQRAR